jgi:UPF0716 protein FxsA
VVVVLAFLLWAAAELFVAVKVADAIGVLAAVVLLVLSWPLGSWALRTQGRAAWRRLGDAIAAGRSPGREVLDGALILLGGILLIIPGFIADVLGILALLPPTRALMRRPLARSLRSRVVIGATGFTGASRSYDVDSTATDVDPPRLHP